MVRRILRALENELVKSVSTKFLYLGIILCAALPFFCSEGFKQMGLDDDLNGFSFITNSTQAAMTSLIPMFILIHASLLIVTETSNGTFRDILVHPLSRTEFLTAKVLTGLIYILVLISVNLLSAIIICIWRYPFDTIIEDGEILVSSLKLVSSLSVAYLIVLLPLAGVFSFGFFISSISRSFIGSIGFSLGIYIGIEPFKFLIPIGEHHLDRYLFSSYLDAPFSILNDLAAGMEISWNSPKISWCIGLSVFSMLIFFISSFLIFLRRDLNG
jgi:ABC-type transport system involved in multi-copper enzyme maturation permease subunit